ncbi:tRNA (N6-threonylcarbamoyladenosine(37)-N6)-methyltransferase TrmO [Motiliproteus sp. SC1-56]|uniref:tRNA (N6-threonylcarbamoyladenosine(37)-N6)-methyltransferase TrmO n=1 Tax=Motiliproteus sp. SC1-56 TaxID=2799565 RepID=UPI001A8F4C39|nr:tRNA (N6-threonylcarbamoyladenosine(37)-N6)-methyltransferase TrmO [Motiliproteus sp. SC1-56]
MQITLTPIGTLRSCFKEKFGIPRQPGLAQAATAILELDGDYAHPDAVRGLEECSHVWVLFLFSEHLERGWTPLVRPPRSGGAKRGVFATRATFRPNPIGMSAVRLERIEVHEGRARLHLSGVDILDGTPVLDIKPYLPYADSLPQAAYSYAPDGEGLEQPVNYSDQARDLLQGHPDGAQLQQLIEEVLRCDPRPTYRRRETDDRLYGTLLHEFNVRWSIDAAAIRVESIEPAAP